jgi:hypothetical protein
MTAVTRRMKKRAFILLLFLSLGGCGLLAFYLCLPSLVELILLPVVVRESGLQDVSFDIRHMGVSHTEIGPVRIGAGDPAAVEVRSIRIEYTPGTLRKKRVAAVIVDGVTIRCRIVDGRPVLPGIDLAALKSGQADAPPRSASYALPPLPLDRLQVRNGMLLITYANSDMTIPFDMRVRSGDTGRRIEAMVSAECRDQRMLATIRADARDNSLVIQVTGERLQPARFLDLLPTGVTGHIAGSLSLSSATRVRLAPAALLSSSTRMVWYDARALFCSGSRTFAITPVEKEAPVALEVTAGENGRRWRLSGPSLAVEAGPRLTLAGLQLVADVDGDNVVVDGAFQAGLDLAAAGLPVALDRPIALPLALAAKWEKQGGWQVEVSASPDVGATVAEPYRMATGDARATIAPPLLKATAKGDHSRGTASWEVSVPTLKIDASTAKVHARDLTASGTIAFAAEGWTAALQSGLKNVHLEAGPNALQVPTMKLTGEVRSDAANGPGIRGLIAFAGGTFRNPDAGIVVKGIEGRQPWVWALEEEARKRGTMRIAGIRFGGRDLGNVIIHTRQLGQLLRFSGKHDNGLFRGLAVTFNGSLALLDENGPSADLAFSVPAYTPDTPVSLGGYLPALDGARFTGTIAAGGTVSLAGGDIGAAVDFDLKEGSFTWPERKLTMSGLRTAISLKELPTMRTMPGQRLQFDSATIGSIRIDGGSVDFQLESPRSFLMEKGMVSWCGGRMGAQALRIVPGVNRYDTTLYCDRLNLTRLLEQLGGVRGEGSGTVNGRIPLIIKDGRFAFHDGFLYSSPGEGGRIRLTGTDELAAGIPVDLAQTGYLELAREALKDYEYNWVKLHLASEGDELMMQLKFDGKPSGTLPFVFREDIGGFARVDAGHPGSNFQGLSLDVNLRLPLDKILQYRDITDMLQ